MKQSITAVLLKLKRSNGRISCLRRLNDQPFQQQAKVEQAQLKLQPQPRTPAQTDEDWDGWI